MKILNLYVLRGFLLAFGMAILILTFGMTGANLIKVFDFIAKGIPLVEFFKFTLYILPVILTFTVPWAVMVGVMLVFGRLSADSEITAMRACGVSILQIVSPILLFTLALTGLCLYLQVELGPPLLGKSRQLMTIAGINQPQALFDPGRAVEFNNLLICVDDKPTEDTVSGVQIYKLGKNGVPEQDISALSGKIEVDHEAKIMTVRLFDCRIVDKTSVPATHMFNAELLLPFDYGKQMSEINVGSRDKFMTLKELIARIRIVKMMKRDTTSLEVELNQRIAFALSPIAFLLLGLPLAIRTSRRETSVGLFLSVILAGAFFMSIILCESLTKFTWLYPQYLLWLPNILFQTIGAVMTYRISQR